MGARAKETYKKEGCVTPAEFRKQSTGYMFDETFRELVALANKLQRIHTPEPVGPNEGGDEPKTS